MKLHSRVYSQSAWHFESQERLDEVCVLHHEYTVCTLVVFSEHETTIEVQKLSSHEEYEECGMTTYILSPLWAGKVGKNCLKCYTKHPLLRPHLQTHSDNL